MAGFKRQIPTDDPASINGLVLGGLASRQVGVYCACQRCGHSAMVDTDTLVHQLGPELPVAEVGTRMRCGGCGSKDVATHPGWLAGMMDECLPSAGHVALSRSA